MQAICESGYIGPSKHSLASNNDPIPSKLAKTSKNVSNDVIAVGKIHYLGPNKMILTYYETEKADPALEDHFKRSLSASGQELKAAFAEQQRTKKVPPSYWTKNMKPPPARNFPVSVCGPSLYPSSASSISYPYQSRYPQNRQFNEAQSSSSYGGTFLKPAPPSAISFYPPPSPSGQSLPPGSVRYGPGPSPHALPGVSHIPQHSSGAYGSFFPGMGPSTSSRIGAPGGNPYAGAVQQSRGSDWVVPPPLGGPFGAPSQMDFGNPSATGAFGPGILPPPAYGSFGPGVEGVPSSSQDSFLSSSAWTSFI